MKVLIVGSGGREHAIATAVAKSPKVDKIYCAPGNAGIGQVAECVNIGAMEFDKLVDFAKEKEIDLTVIGMDDPLVGGIVDKFEEAGLRVFGPRMNALADYVHIHAPKAKIMIHQTWAYEQNSKRLNEEI